MTDQRKLAEAMGWRARSLTYGGVTRWGLADANEQPVRSYSRLPFRETEDEAWELDCPPFSTDTPEGWGAMSMVVKEMKRREWRPSIETTEADTWVARFEHDFGQDGICHIGYGDSLPEAVARAALAALEATDATTD